MSTPRSRAISVNASAVKAPSASFPACASPHRLAPTERDAEGEIARLGRRAGQDQIAEPGEPHQGLAARAEGVAEPAQFGETPGDQGRDRARAEAAARRDAAGDREHVLGRAANLHAADVGRVIKSEVRPMQLAAERAGQRLVGGGERHRGRQAGGDVRGEGRAGKDRRSAARRDLSEHLRHKGVGAALDALGAGDERRRSGKRRKPRGRLARCLRWRRNQDRGAARKRIEFGGRDDALGEAHPGSLSLSRVASSAAIASPSRPHSTTSRPAAAAALASAVPHAPAPATPTTNSLVTLAVPFWKWNPLTHGAIRAHCARPRGLA